MMTHGSIDATQMSPTDIAALYDLVLLGMQDYIARHEGCASFVNGLNPWDAAAIYHALVRAGVFEDPLTFNRFSLIVERALWQKSFAFDDASVLQEVEKMLMKLGVMSSVNPLFWTNPDHFIDHQANQMQGLKLRR